RTELLHREYPFGQTLANTGPSPDRGKRSAVYRLLVRCRAAYAGSRAHFRVREPQGEEHGFAASGPASRKRRRATSEPDFYGSRRRASLCDANPANRIDRL